MSDSIDRRESVKKGALAALALSLGVPERLLAENGTARFQFKFYAGDRLLETLDVEEATRYLDARPTAIEIKWYDMKTDRRDPLSTLGLTESFQIKYGEVDSKPRLSEPELRLDRDG